MKIKLAMIVGITLLTTTVQAKEESGETLFKTKCATCHITHRPTDFSKLVAPPVMGITRHVKMAHPKREDFKAFVKDYVINPSKDKALCAKHTIKRFNIMPSQKGKVTDEELDKIANYLYDNFAKGNMQGMGCQRGMRGQQMGNFKSGM